MWDCYSKIKPDICNCGPAGPCKYAVFPSHNPALAFEVEPSARSESYHSSEWRGDGSAPKCRKQPVDVLDKYPEAIHRLAEISNASGMAPDSKPSNPKDGVGSRKVGFHAIPFTVLWELGNSMGEGGYKYGTHNYREAGVRASVYFDATVARHLGAWWEGEDIDPDSGENHVTKAIASLVVLRDSMIQGNWVDDRPIKSDPNLLREANKRAAALADKYPNPVAPYLAKVAA